MFEASLGFMRSFLGGGEFMYQYQINKYINNSRVCTEYLRECGGLKVGDKLLMTKYLIFYSPTFSRTSFCCDPNF